MSRGMRRLTDAIEYGLVLTLATSLSSLPWQAAYAIGGQIGSLWYRLDHRHRQIALDNLALAFGDALEPEERETLARAVFANLGRTLLDTCRLPRLSREDIAGRITVTGLEHQRRAWERGRGIIYATAHFGPWEYLPCAPVFLGHPLLGVTRRMDNPYIEGRLRAQRARWGATLEKKGAMPRLLKHLRENGGVGILVDQNVSREEGVFVEFFGHPACTTPAAALLAMRSKAPIVPVVVGRVGPGRFCLEFGEEIPVVSTGQVRQDAVATTGTITKAIEQFIRRSPDQWFWVHRRWKTRPEGER
ncbi:MAG: lysophospholipid acyltransferase family protein [Candidatus Methylomirabilales bacterium]